MDERVSFAGILYYKLSVHWCTSAVPWGARSDRDIRLSDSERTRCGTLLHTAGTSCR